MNGRKLRKVMHDGQCVFGTLITTPSPHWPVAVRDTGVDFVFIDTEHIPLERTTLAWMCRTYSALDVAPIVRIPSPDPYAACVALDGGAEGLVAPYVETAEEARLLVGAVRHRPLKGSLLKRITHQGETPEEPLGSYIEERCAGNILLLNIESVPAIESLDAVLAVPGFDGVLIGPHDLSCSLGVPEQYEHPRFLEAVETILRKARSRGYSAGIHYWRGVEPLLHWIRQGANFIVHSADITLFTDAMHRDLKHYREAAGDAAPAIPNPINI
ncbi:MAG: hypothetical protein KIT83_00880 [Bryobacterales bacterium]|nr:hypothetical protein [Bryobacterales bacterium]